MVCFQTIRDRLFEELSIVALISSVKTVANYQFAKKFSHLFKIKQNGSYCLFIVFCTLNWVYI